MRRFIQIFMTLILLLPSQVWCLDVVPGLKVFGGTTRAAYGNNSEPSICIVNTLKPTATIVDSTRNGVVVKTGGLKSLIDWDKDNKMIIFEVGGSIVYYGKMKIDNNYVTLAGQTAPSPGISIYGTQLDVDGNDVLIQHIRVRAGDNAIGVTGGNRNAIEWFGSNGVADHCSFSWAPDGIVGIGASKNVTFSNSIFSEGLRYSIHSDVNKHSTGLLTTETINHGIINNLFAHNDWRNPSVKGSGQSLLIANNLIYNPGVYNIFSNNEGKAASNYNIVGNVSIGGNNSDKNVKYYIPYLLRTQNPDTNFYIVDNKVGAFGGAFDIQDDASDWDRVKMVDASIETNTKNTRVTFPYPAGYTPMPSSEVEAYVLDHVGARPADRDVVDARIVAEVKTGKGSLIDTIEYKNTDCTGLNRGPNGIILACCTGTGTGTCVRNKEGGWPSIGSDSITRNDLPADPHGDDDGDGYTNLEEWIHTFSAKVEGSGKETLLYAPKNLKIIQ